MYINKAFKIAFALKSVVLMHIAVKIKKKKQRQRWQYAKVHIVSYDM